MQYFLVFQWWWCWYKKDEVTQKKNNLLHFPSIHISLHSFPLKIKFSFIHHDFLSTYIRRKVYFIIFFVHFSHLFFLTLFYSNFTIIFCRVWQMFENFTFWLFHNRFFLFFHFILFIFFNTWYRQIFFCCNNNI